MPPADRPRCLGATTSCPDTSHLMDTDAMGDFCRRGADGLFTRSGKLARTTDVGHYTLSLIIALIMLFVTERETVLTCSDGRNRTP